jgi:hypothetical protein
MGLKITYKCLFLAVLLHQGAPLAYRVLDLSVQYEQLVEIIKHKVQEQTRLLVSD